MPLVGAEPVGIAVQIFQQAQNRVALARKDSSVGIEMLLREPADGPKDVEGLCDVPLLRSGSFGIFVETQNRFVEDGRNCVRKEHPSGNPSDDSAEVVRRETGEDMEAVEPLEKGLLKVRQLRGRIWERDAAEWRDGALRRGAGGGAAWERGGAGRSGGRTGGEGRRSSGGRSGREDGALAGG
jgi:uncharacterized membrane protein YgcG